MYTSPGMQSQESIAGSKTVILDSDQCYQNAGKALFMAEAECCAQGLFLEATRLRTEPGLSAPTCVSCPFRVPLHSEIQKMVQTDIPKATKACPCPDHHSGGYLPMPRDQAVMPYWVPRVLRSCKKIQNMVQSDTPKVTKACPCPDHHSGGYLPVPRDQAVMPYWVPRVLRSCKKVVKRQQSFKSIKESPLDSHSWHHRWRICCSRHLLLKWLQLQALHQEGQLAPERRVIPQPSFLPLCLSFLAFLQAVLRAISFIRHFWGV
ncbi:uncharacterized protein C16orf95 homolog isoform X3 [Myotis lucifugus]|uniref:uncharacterized protein C16orf95 homolog isoform X3 n=1 Tax=Myotis lucifugus TaxID=59463 RepID=UPI000CCC202D|nr:uncharacterized protein C16orf95 homolog isoform X3 [Myotis lucifugus]